MSRNVTVGKERRANASRTEGTRTVKMGGGDSKKKEKAEEEEGKDPSSRTRGKCKRFSEKQFGRGPNIATLSLQSNTDHAHFNPCHGHAVSMWSLSLFLVYICMYVYIHARKHTHTLSLTHTHTHICTYYMEKKNRRFLGCMQDSVGKQRLNAVFANLKTWIRKPKETLYSATATRRDEVCCRGFLSVSFHIAS